MARLNQLFGSRVLRRGGLREANQCRKRPMSRAHTSASLRPISGG
jgi:hypothetical protein